MKVRHIYHLLFAVVAGLFFSACSTYRSDALGVRTSFMDGRPEDTARIAGAQVENRQNRNNILLWHLEQGTALRYAGRFDESNAAFDRADNEFRFWDQQPSTKISNTPVWVFANPGETPYRGRSYDRILMNSYKALNYMSMGNMEAARVELNRSLAAQQEAVAANARRLEEAEEAVRLAREGNLNTEEGTNIPAYDISETLAAQNISSQLASIGQVDSYLRPYGDYVNPFAVFLDGLYFTFQATGASDLERGRVSFDRVAQLSPGPHSQADAQMVNRLAAGERLPRMTYVILETGHGPVREESKLSLPIFLVSSRVAYVSVAFPELRVMPGYNRLATVEADGRSYETQLLASMDSIVAQDFKNDWDATVRRSLVSATAKVAAAYFVEDAVRRNTSADQLEGQLLRLFTRLAVIAYQELSTRADLRVWMTLPKEFQYARLQTPASGTLSVLIGSRRHELTIRQDGTNVIYIREFANNSIPVIQQFYLP